MMKRVIIKPVAGDEAGDPVDLLRVREHLAQRRRHELQLREGALGAQREPVERGGHLAQRPAAER